jgi:transcriptional regulator with XRE-family HTH domain
MDVLHPAHAYDVAACGRAIARARLAADLTLDELAARSGVSRRHLVDLEHGNNGPSTRVLYAISLGLGVDGADLFREGFPAAPASIPGSGRAAGPPAVT